MKKAGIITATRAEYGLLSPVIRELRRFENDAFQAQLIVTGTHLSRGRISSGSTMRSRCPFHQKPWRTYRPTRRICW